MRVSGQLIGELRGCMQVGAYPAARITGLPISWTTPGPTGAFEFFVPPGSWHIHAVSADPWGFPDGDLWGSYGGFYGLGRPVAVCHYPVSGLEILVSARGRDMAHIAGHSRPAVGVAQQTAVRKAMQMLAADLACPDLADLGPEVGLVRTRLSALFRRATGVTLAEYRMRLRLELAKALLAGTDADILDVALEVGYGTPAALGRVFRRYLNLSPGEFRRLAREVPNRCPVVPARPNGMVNVTVRTLKSLRAEGATISGRVTYDGGEVGAALYVLAFRGTTPGPYPAAWTAIPRPGEFTLEGVPAGRYHLFACYCAKRMERAGDFRSAFASGGCPAPVTVKAGEDAEGISISLRPGIDW